MPPERPAEPDAAPVADRWCIDTPPPQPVPGTGDPAPLDVTPDEFAVCLYEEERTLLVLYISSLRGWSEQQYAIHGCE